MGKVETKNTHKKMEELFTYLSVAQGGIVMGITLFILAYYIPKNSTERSDALRWHIVSIASSYILLTWATVKTAATMIYEVSNIWYWIVMLAYLLGDISLIIIFRKVVRRNRQKNIEEELRNEIKKQSSHKH